MKTAVSPDIELVEILLYLSDRQKKTVQVLENDYYISKIESRFGRFRSHEAVALTRRLIDERNFIHIKPIRAILSLEAVGGEAPLRDWASAVRLFKADTKFDRFFDKNTPYYAMILEKVKAFDVQKCVDFTLSYFKGGDAALNLIICPFAGNYGFIHGGVSNVVRCLPYDENGRTDERYIKNFIRGFAHEYAHCFVNPVIEKHKGELERCRMFFARHEKMHPAYNVDYAVMNEYFVRAYVRRYLALNSTVPDEAADKWERETFICIDDFVGALCDYEKGDGSFEDLYLRVLPKLGGST